jgi:PHD/YefM family antitoxin component YafN of YafNO toxin-antitoxin module
MSKRTITLKHPLTHEPLPVIFEQGQPQAVILDLSQFTQIVEALDPVARTDEEEATFLAQSPTFQRLIERGLNEMQAGRGRPWRDFLAEL